MEDPKSRHPGLRSWAPHFGLAVAAAALLASALSAPQPAAATITVGSDLTAPLGSPPGEPSRCWPVPPPCTSLLGGVHKGNAFPATSPTDGTVVAFQVKSGGPETITFRLGSIDQRSIEAKTKATAVGPTVNVPGPGTYSFPTSLPIGVGESPGLDSFEQRSYGGCYEGGYYFSYSPPLVEGAPPTPVGANSPCELLVNVVVEPSSVFTVRTVRLKRSSGRATLGLVLPGPGRVLVSGRGIKKVQRAATAAGKLSVPIRPVGRVRTKLRAAGSARVRARIAFTPNGGGTRKRSKSIRLVER